MLMVRELHQGGCERDLTKLAIHIDRSRFEPHVGCFHAAGIRGDELRHAGVPVLPLPVTGFRSVSALRGALQFGQYLERHRISLVQSFDVPMNLFAVPVARLARTPVVLSSQLSHRRLLDTASWRLSRLIDRMVDAVVVNCEAMRRHMIEDERMPPKSLRLCYNGIDTDVFSPARLPKPPALAHASLVVGIVCALRPEKDLETLLRAFAQVRHALPGLVLLIVGSGPLLPRLELLREELGLSPAQCHFEPATRDVAQWLRAIDIFVLPSVSEALSNSLMEAMACGCAVIGSRVGGTPELIEDGRTGLLFEPGDVAGLYTGLLRLVRDDLTREALGRAAADMIRSRYSVESYVRRMQAIYADLLDGV